MYFDTRKAIGDAWNFLWADNLAQRAKGHDFRGNTYYLTAADLENQVRHFAQEQLDGKPRGSTGRAMGRGWITVRISGNLQATVRDWLLTNPSIESHNFGRGHISRMRFRPRGEPLATSEQKTIAAHVARRANPKEPRRHYSTHGYGGSPLCTQARRSVFSHRSKAWTTNDKVRVTCPSCRKLMEAK